MLTPMMRGRACWPAAVETWDIDQRVCSAVRQATATATATVTFNGQNYYTIAAINGDVITLNGMLTAECRDG